MQEFVQGFPLSAIKFLADTAASGVDAGTGRCPRPTRSRPCSASGRSACRAVRRIWSVPGSPCASRAGSEVQGGRDWRNRNSSSPLSKEGLSFWRTLSITSLWAALLQLGAQSLIVAVQFLLGSEEIIQSLTLDLPLTLVKPATLECVDNDPGQQANG